MKVCEHGIRLHRSCPWCKRKDIPTEVFLSLPKKGFQFYQMFLNSFLQAIAGNSEGYTSISIVSNDVNGNIYSMVEGPLEELEIHLTALEERIKEERRRRKC